MDFNAIRDDADRGGEGESGVGGPRSDSTENDDQSHADDGKRGYGVGLDEGDDEGDSEGEGVYYEDDEGHTIFHDDLDEFEGGGGGADWADMLPTWSPTDPVFGIICDGLCAAMIGHKGGGKSRVMTSLCPIWREFIDRAICYSSTDVKTGQFSENNLIHPVYVDDEPSPEAVGNLMEERKGEMNIWSQHKKRGKPYRMRYMLAILDDAAHAGEVLATRSRDMMYLANNSRHLRLHMVIALQSTGLMNKQLRMSMDLIFIVREHNGEALGSIYDTVFKGNTPISPAVFRDIMDSVCIKGKRVLVWDCRHGALFKYDLDFDKITLDRPIGNAQWLRWGNQHQKKEWDRELEHVKLERLARERWTAQPKRGRRRK